MATAAVTPFVGAISDLIGRRWVALSGLILIIGGLLVIGLAETMAVAIGGNALVGVGAGLAEMIGFAGSLETIPVKSRGKVIGILFVLYLPICGCSTFGTSPFSISI
jgi:MFS family permease